MALFTNQDVDYFDNQHKITSILKNVFFVDI